MILSWAGAMLQESQTLSATGDCSGLVSWLGCLITDCQKGSCLVTWMALQLNSEVEP